MKHWIFINH